MAVYGTFLFDVNKIAAKNKEEKGAIFSVGPYDVPRKMKIYRELGHVFFKFSYLDEEKKTIKKSYQGIDIEKGKYSGRIISICIPEFFYKELNSKEFNKIISKIPKLIEDNDYDTEVSFFHWETVRNALSSVDYS